MSANISAVLTAGYNDRDHITAMLARAFADDPAMSFIFPDAALRAKRLPRLFRLIYDVDTLAGMPLVTVGGEAATLWRGPGQARIGGLAMLRQALPMLATFGRALPRALAVSSAIEAHFPLGITGICTSPVANPPRRAGAMAQLRSGPASIVLLAAACRPIWRPRPKAIWAYTARSASR
nr:hypothetical protein [Sphingomonas sp. ZFBP2030]